jgi:hypothetical protein
MNANEHYCIENSQANKGKRGKPGKPGTAGKPGQQGKDGLPGNKGPKGSSKVDINFQQAYRGVDRYETTLPYAIYNPRGTNIQIVRHSIFPGTTSFGSNLSTFKLGIGMGSSSDLAGWTFNVNVYFRERTYIGTRAQIKELLITPTANTTGTSQNYIIYTKTFTDLNKDNVLPTIIRTEGDFNPGTYIDTANLSTTPQIHTIELEVVPITAPNGVDIWVDPGIWSIGGIREEDVVLYSSAKEVRQRAEARKAKLESSFRTDWAKDFDTKRPKGPVLSTAAVRALNSINVYLYSAEYF